jgi:hypothetical protein
MVAPLGKLSPFSLKHMVGLGGFFMSSKEKGPKLPWEQSCPSRKKNYKLLSGATMSLKVKKGLKLTNE